MTEVLSDFVLIVSSLLDIVTSFNTDHGWGSKYLSAEFSQIIKSLFVLLY